MHSILQAALGLSKIVLEKLEWIMMNYQVIISLNNFLQKIGKAYLGGFYKHKGNR